MEDASWFIFKVEVCSVGIIASSDGVAGLISTAGTAGAAACAT